MLRFTCPQCYTALEFGDSVRSSVVQCDSCGQKFRVPEAKTKAAPPPLPTAQGETSEPPPVPTATSQPPPVPEDDPVDWPDLAPEPYQPDGGMAPAGSIIVLAICLVVSVIMGFLASFVGQWFYLILVFPVLIGFAVGGAGILGVYLGKVRAPWWAGLVGFLSGCFAMATVQYVDYMRVQKLLPGIPMSFFEYVDRRAEIGVTIGRVRAPNQGGGMNLGYVGSYIYWILETLIVAGIAFAMMASRARDPFCNTCNHWKKKQFLGYLNADIGNAAMAIEAGDLHFLDHHQRARAGAANLKVEARVCPVCESESPFELQVYEENKNQNQYQHSPLAQASYPGYGLPVLEELFSRHRVSSDQ